MTKQRALKQRIRQRMAKTGERYTTARAHILNSQSNSNGTLSGFNPVDFPGLLPNYQNFGGIQGETAILRNVLQSQNIGNPETGEPYSEALLHGLCGGLGFMVAVFEYKGWPPMTTLTMRSGTMPSSYMMPVFKRLGLKIHETKTTSQRVSEKSLRAALESGKAAICLVDLAGLPYYAIPDQLTGMGPHYVAVVGIQENESGALLWLDDRSSRPCQVSLSDVEKARGAYRAGKRHLLTIEGVETHESGHWCSAIKEAIQATIQGLEAGDVGVPKQFRVNCGFSGMEKWHKLLTDKRGKKAWISIFNEANKVFAGLRRVYECLQFEYTAPNGSRPFYAKFLREVNSMTGAKGLKDSAELFEEAGEAWKSLTDVILSTEDESLAEACRLCDERAETLDHEGSSGREKIEIIQARLKELRTNCKISQTETADVFQKMAKQLQEVIRIERSAVQCLKSGYDELAQLN